DWIFSIIFVTQTIFVLECTNYESFQVDEGECSIEEPGIEVKSTTECLLHCGMEKCMNSLIKNQTCYCTDTECVPQRKQQSLHDANFFTSPLQKVTIEPICYGTKGSSFASFNVPQSGRIKYFKLIHVSGYVSCSNVNGNSTWACKVMEPSTVLTGITNTNNQIIAPPGIHDNGKFQIQGVNHMNDRELILPAKSSIEVKKKEELRIWYTEDLVDYKEQDNIGTHCIHVLLKYC
uniref:Uncharacterized protein n=1 Tax=Clytia hemisphaerica TaxID=252671 RepID=A0A7M5X9N9_9CNID